LVYIKIEQLGLRLKISRQGGFKVTRRQGQRLGRMIDMQ